MGLGSGSNSLVACPSRSRVLREMSSACSLVLGVRVNVSQQTKNEVHDHKQEHQRKHELNQQPRNHPEFLLWPRPTWRVRNPSVIAHRTRGADPAFSCAPSPALPHLG